MSERVPLRDLRALAAFRYELRCFLAFSERAARAAKIEPQQHQLLLAIAGLPHSQRPNIRALAERLCVQHHTTVALVDRLEQRGLLRRERSTEDKREVLLRLTDAGSALLDQLSREHRAHLQRVGPEMVAALGSILDGHGWDSRSRGEANERPLEAAPGEPAEPPAGGEFLEPPLSRPVSRPGPRHLGRRSKAG